MDLRGGRRPWPMLTFECSVGSPPARDGVRLKYRLSETPLRVFHGGVGVGVGAGVGGAARRPADPPSGPEVHATCSPATEPACRCSGAMSTLSAARPPMTISFPLYRWEPGDIDVGLTVIALPQLRCGFGSFACAQSAVCQRAARWCERVIKTRLMHRPTAKVYRAKVDAHLAVGAMDERHLNPSDPVGEAVLTPVCRTCWRPQGTWPGSG